MGAQSFEFSLAVRLLALFETAIFPAWRGAFFLCHGCLLWLSVAAGFTPGGTDEIPTSWPLAHDERRYHGPADQNDGFAPYFRQ